MMSKTRKEQDLLSQGNKLWGEGKSLEALTKYTEAIQANPEFTPALSQILSVVISRLIVNYEERCEFEKAIIYARFWVEISNRQNPYIYLHLARLLLKDGEINPAIFNYEKAFELQPQQPTWVLEEMVQSLKKNKQGCQGILTYEKTIWLNVSHGYFFYALGDIYASKSEQDKALINYQRAIEFLPEESLLYEKLAIIFDQKGELDQAISHYEIAISLEPRLDFYFQLAKIQKRKGNFNQAIDNYKKAIRINPSVLFCYQAFFEACLEKDTAEEAINKFISFIEKLGTISYSTYEHLFFNIVRLHGTNVQKGQFLNGITLKDKDAEVFHKIWQNLNQVDAETIKNINFNLDIDTLKLYFLKKTSDYKPINISQELNRENLLLLEDCGLSLNYLQLNHNGWIPEKTTSQGLPKQVLSLTNQNEFHRELISQGKIDCICPFTGEIIHSDTCIPYAFGGIAHCNYFFRFVSKEVFYLITGFVYGQKIALYFPHAEIIVPLTGFDDKLLWFIEVSINALKTYMVSNQIRCINFFNRSKKISKKVVILSDAHLGHHLWNKLSGIYQIYKRGQLNYIDEFLVIAEPLGKLEDIFPEIPPSKIKKTDSFNDSQVNLFIDSNYLPVSYGHNFVEEKLIDRIYRAALKNCPHAVIQEIEDAKKEHFPLLWINIRTGSRSWISQIEGTANIINKLAEKFPNLGIVFDGISLLEGQSNNYSSPPLEEEKKVVHKIKSLIEKPVKTYNLIGRIINENLVWVNNIDLYLSHWGNALTKSVLIANKPGVVHCNQQDLKIPITERWISWQRENCVLPTYISPDDIQDCSVISYDIRSDLDNYDIDWQVIYQELLKVIPQCERYHSQMEAYYKSRLEAIKADLESSRVRLAEIRGNLSDNFAEGYQ